jgi:undecaprenyl diphosphate synthase
MARVPNHIGIIPDGNRRWAVMRGLAKEAGYETGLAPGLEMLKVCKHTGIRELTFYEALEWYQTQDVSLGG